jgi:hypothetical protein
MAAINTPNRNVSRELVINNQFAMLDTAFLRVVTTDATLTSAFIIPAPQAIIRHWGVGITLPRSGGGGTEVIHIRNRGGTTDLSDTVTHAAGVDPVNKVLFAWGPAAGGSGGYATPEGERLDFFFDVVGTVTGSFGGYIWVNWAV